MIAEVAVDIGLEKVTLKAVADRLGVSIPALYKHVAGREDLMALSAGLAAGEIPVPEERGQHWAVWLLEWAVYNRDVFLGRPGLLVQYLEGAPFSSEAITSNIDLVLGHLVRAGFEVHEANAAFEAVVACALGVAVGTIRGATSARRDHRLEAVEMGGRPLPYFRALQSSGADAHDRGFQHRIVLVIRGVAATHGRRWPPIARALSQHLGYPVG